MPNEIRLRADAVAGATDVALATGDTTLSSPALADLPAVGTAQHAALTLFVRDSATGRITKRETVWVTAHTAAATTATILRAQEGTTAQAWASASLFVHGPTANDLLRIGRSIHSVPDIDHAANDEFQDLRGQSGNVNGLAAKWTARAIVAADVKTAAADVQGGAFIITPSIAGGWGLQQTFTPAGDCTVVARLGIQHMSERQMIGLYVTNAAGNGVILKLDSADVPALYALSGFGLGATATNLVSTEFASGRMLRFVVRKVGGVYHATFQHDDVAAPSRIRYVTLTPPGFVVERIGIGRVFGSGISEVTLDYFRVTEP